MIEPIECNFSFLKDKVNLSKGISGAISVFKKDN